MTDTSPVIQLRALAAKAMIGSDRSGSQAASPEKLLSLAAVTGTQSRAGYRPRQCAGRVPECPSDPKPAAGNAPTTSLMRLLSEPDAGLIEEWAALAHARGQRVADHAVPVLLDWWSRQPQRRGVVFSVCGARGEWLASLNPGWRKPVAGDELPANADEVWQTGKTPERLAVLLTTRRHDPARALALIQSTWASDGADERRRFVESLALCTSMADEPFLEAALDDKSKVVRRAAAAVLVTLSGSRFKSRMNERAKTIIVVTMKKGLLKKSRSVCLNPPQTFDKTWERDGLEEEAPGGMGKRAWWMRQVLGAADLSVWTDVTQLGPEGVLEAIAEDDHFGTALGALIQALEARSDAPWAAAVLHTLLAAKKLDPTGLARLLRPLPPEQGLPLLLTAAEHKRFGGADRWAILAIADHPWPREFSSKALQVLRQSTPPKGDVWGLYQPVETVSRLVSPELAEDFAETVVAMFPDGPSESFKKSIDRVRLRADMHKEFAS